MIINNSINISKYKAQVSSKLIQPCQIEMSSDRVGNYYFMLNEKDNFKDIEIRILFKGSDREDVYKNISDFMTLLKNEVDIKFNNLPHNYHCFITESSLEETEFEDWLYLNLKLQGYEYGELITVNSNLTSSCTINNLGNIDTPCIIEITPTTVGLIDFVITGVAKDTITVKSLQKGEKVIIDGIDGSVKVGDSNKYGDTEMWEFPYLKPGLNNITFNRNTCNVTIKFSPRYF